MLPRRGIRGRFYRPGGDLRSDGPCSSAAAHTHPHTHARTHARTHAHTHTTHQRAHSHTPAASVSGKTRRFASSLNIERRSADARAVYARAHARASARTLAQRGGGCAAADNGERKGEQRVCSGRQRREEGRAAYPPHPPTPLRSHLLRVYAVLYHRPPFFNVPTPFFTTVNPLFHYFGVYTLRSRPSGPYAHGWFVPFTGRTAWPVNACGACALRLSGRAELPAVRGMAPIFSTRCHIPHRNGRRNRRHLLLGAMTPKLARHSPVQENESCRRRF